MYKCHKLYESYRPINPFYTDFSSSSTYANKTFCASMSKAFENEFHIGAMNLIIKREYISGHIPFLMKYSHKLIGSSGLYSLAKVL